MRAERGTIASQHYVHSDEDDEVKEVPLPVSYDTRPCFYVEGKPNLIRDTEY